MRSSASWYYTHRYQQFSISAEFGRHPIVRACVPSQVDVEAIYRAGVYSWDHTSPRMVSRTTNVDTEPLMRLLHILTIIV